MNNLATRLILMIVACTLLLAMAMVKNEAGPEEPITKANNDKAVIKID